MIRLLPSSHLAIIPASVYSSRPDPKDPTVNHTATAGLTVAVLHNQIIIEAVDPDSAAAQAGVHPGWIVDSVNHATVEQLFEETADLPQTSRDELIPHLIEDWLNGPENSAVTLELHNTEAQHSTYTLKRRPIPGNLVTFGNLPPEHVRLDYRALPNGVGYIRLNLFLDPVTVMPEFEKTIIRFQEAPGIVLDLRNNPGGLGVMAMGIAGWFVSKDGQQLGQMTGRDESMNFIINPRLHAFEGRLAILVNGASASTSEILAQGLQDLGRARIFGTPTAGAALPSDIIRLPNGDRFQYPEANYTSFKGRVLEGNGVQPDVVAAPTVQALLENRDLALEAAMAWCKQK